MPYNPTRALELLRLGTQSPRATFRDGQEDAIQHVVDGRGRLLVVQKTGWGKSSVYFIATKLLREEGMGPAILISPLLALMRNQVAAADKSACLAKDAACVQSCGDLRTACAQPLQTAIDAAIESCEATRRTAVATCVATTPPGPERDACIETADSTAFVCRDDAREAQAPGLAECTKAYVGCVRACPPA